VVDKQNDLHIPNVTLSNYTRVEKKQNFEPPSHNTCTERKCGENAKIFLDRQEEWLGAFYWILGDLGVLAVNFDNID
jgi:hypothetical protein